MARDYTTDDLRELVPSQHVDHVVELQLAAAVLNHTATRTYGDEKMARIIAALNELDNLQLLAADKNQEKGKAVGRLIRRWKLKTYGLPGKSKADVKRKVKKANAQKGDKKILDVVRKRWKRLCRNLDFAKSFRDGMTQLLKTSSKIKLDEVSR